MEYNVLKTDFLLTEYKVAYTKCSLSLKPTTVVYTFTFPRQLKWGVFLWLV
jgi:hypothetical protein